MRSRRCGSCRKCASMTVWWYRRRRRAACGDVCSKIFFRLIFANARRIHVDIARRIVFATPQVGGLTANRALMGGTSDCPPRSRRSWWNCRCPHDLSEVTIDARTRITLRARKIAADKLALVVFKLANPVQRREVARCQRGVGTRRTEIEILSIAGWEVSAVRARLVGVILVTGILVALSILRLGATLNPIRSCRCERRIPRHWGNAAADPVGVLHSENVLL